MRALNQKIVIVAILAFLSLETAQGATWVTKRLTNNKGDSENPAIAVNGSNLYVVWSDETPGKYGIFFLRSGSGGKTWKAPQRLTENYVFYKDPAIAVNESSVYVVWSDSPPEKPETEIYFLRSTDGGETWKAPKRLTNTSRTSCDPSIAVDGSNLYVVWVDITPGNPEIYFIRSSDGGKTWKAPKRLTDNKGESNGPAIIANGLNLYVFWSDDSLENYEIYFLRSTDGGKTWKAPKRLTNQAGNSWSPSIAVNGLNLYVVWWEHLNDEIGFLRSTDGGKTWEAPQNLTNNFSFSLYPFLAVDGSSIYVVWADRTLPKYFEVYLVKSADGGATWKAPQRLTNNTGNSISPAIAVNGSNLYVVWSDYTPGNFEIYFMRSTNGGAMMRGGQED